MRLFTGISPAPHVLENVERALRELRLVAPLHWTALENLHITTKFIGEMPESRLDELRDSLSGIKSPGHITITISRFGFFPNPKNPRVFFAGVNSDPRLVELARQTDWTLEALGCARDIRPYTPHLTLARIGDDQDVLPLREHLEMMGNVDFGTFEADEFILYQSHPGKSHFAYTKLWSFPLRKEVRSGA